MKLNLLSHKNNHKQFYNSVLHTVTIVFLLSNAVVISQNSSKKDSTTYYTSQFSQAINQTEHFPDKAYKNFEKSYLFFKRTNNIKKTTQCLTAMSDIQKTKGKFSLAFDHLWEALYDIKDAPITAQKANVHKKLSSLYDNFNKDKESLYHLERALQLSKIIAIETKGNTQLLNASYLSLAVRQRKSGDYNKALRYLDSCVLTQKLIKKNSYILQSIDIERGHLMMDLGNTTAAFKILHTAKMKAIGSNLNFRIRIYSLLGDLKKNTKELDSAIYYFERSRRKSR